MADSTNSTPAAQPAAEDEVKQNRFQRFRANHPRTTKVAGLIAGAVVVAGVVSTVKNMKQNRADLADAADHAKESLNALADSVSTPDPVD